MTPLFWTRTRAAARRVHGISVIQLWILMTLLFGCDNFEPSALLPKTSTPRTAESKLDVAPEEGTSQRIAAKMARDFASPTRPHAPDMESIGPGDSQRIYYQFVDDRGRVQFVERLIDVPEDWRDRIGYVEMNQPPPLTPTEARRSWKLSASRTTEILLATANSPAASQGRQSASVVLYSASWCGYCTKAKKHLDREGVEYEVRDVDDRSIAQELRAKTGRGGVPVLDFSGEILRGYSPQQYDRAIESIKG